jgi:alpha-tubulin suppressor-like RCC1 family protein
VWCWGAGGAGQLGRGVFTKLLVQRKDEALSVYEHALHSDGSSAAEPPAAAALPARAVAVAAGTAHTCALSAAGAVFCWGRNMEDQVGAPQRKLCIGTSGELG